MLKGMGALLFLLGGFLWGRERDGCLTLRVRELSGLLRGAEALTSLICRFSEPLPTALRAAEGERMTLFSEAAQRIEAGERAGEAFSAAVAEEFPYLHLTAEDAECLYRFAEGLSAADREGQERNLAMLRAELGRLLSEAREAREKKGRLYRAGGLLLGGLLGLFLW